MLDMGRSPGILALAAVLALAGCDWLWPLDRADDPERCESSCIGGRVCISGRCVLLDGGIAKDAGSVVDLSMDRAARPDYARLDSTMSDKPPPPDKPPPALSGYGSKCLNGFPACQAGYDCVAVGSATSTFCTKQCSPSGQVCTGTPPGTAAYCLLQNSSTGQYHCSFLCKLDSQTWSCPANLTCSSSPNPPGSKQYPCMP